MITSIASNALAFSAIHDNAGWRWKLARLAATAIAIAVSLVGCTASSRYMAQAPTPVTALTPSPDLATVAFIRSSGLGGLVTFTIIDQEGRFVGDSTAGAHFAVQLPPGEYLFIAEAENTAVMHANLASNKLYYVDVDPKMGLLSARVGLEPIKPGSDAWRRVPERLKDTKRFVPLTSQGQAAIDAQKDTIAARIANAKGKWAGYSPAERAELGLEAADGIGGDATSPSKRPASGATVGSPPVSGGSPKASAPPAPDAVPGS